MDYEDAVDDVDEEVQITEHEGILHPREHVTDQLKTRGRIKCVLTSHYLGPAQFVHRIQSAQLVAHRTLVQSEARLDTASREGRKVGELVVKEEYPLWYLQFTHASETFRSMTHHRVGAVLQYVVRQQDLARFNKLVLEGALTHL